MQCSYHRSYMGYVWPCGLHPQHCCPLRAGKEGGGDIGNKKWIHDLIIRGASTTELLNSGLRNNDE